MTLAKRAIFGISSGTNSDELNAHGFALVDPTSSPSTRTAMQPKDLKGIWDALNWADGLALSLPAFPVTEAPSPTNNNVTTESTHLADVAAAKNYVIAQSNVRVCLCGGLSVSGQTFERNLNPHQSQYEANFRFCP